MKKVISIVLSLLLLLSCFSAITFVASAAPAQLDIPGNYMLVDENENLALYLDSNTGNFGVMNQKTGTVWYSNPLDWQSDPIAKGETLEELNSKITVRYLTSNYSTTKIGRAHV